MSGSRFFGTREHPEPELWATCFLLALAGIGLYFWLQSVLEAKGYEF